MRAYFDSSALVAVYVTEAYSAGARAELSRHVPIPWTALHDLEVRNALRLLHGRTHIDASELRGLLQHVEDDVDSGRLSRPPIDLDTVFNRARTLSAAHASSTLARTLDILHVASLLEIGCSKLVSADERQLNLAKAERLDVLDIRASA